MARRLAGTVIINGTDDENWPQSDEKVNRVLTTWCAEQLAAVSVADWRLLRW
ncbi:MAG: hypothetical protein H0U45_06235 [Tatlockia sp.]|nr:hypothetical protein [Tatlockia sp.]